jgi:hypothetical protein
MTSPDSHTNSQDPQPVPVLSDLPLAVRFGQGPLEGVEGTLVDRRASGRYLIQLHQGVYVEANLVELAIQNAATSEH